MTWNSGEYRPKQKRADEKKSRILDAALELFASRGYHGTTAKTIAARAGVATGSFYRYFRDKKAVFMALCLRSEEALGGRIFEFGRLIRREGRSEQELLNSLIRFSVAAHHENKAFHREVLTMQIRDPDVAAWTRDRERRLLAALLEFLRPMRSSYRVQDLEAAAELIYYAIEEVSHRAVLFDSPVGEERLVGELQDMLLRYLFVTDKIHPQSVTVASNGSFKD
jgi:AcrR family transcriptional regulator